MALISTFLSYLGNLNLLYHASIAIYLNKSDIVLYDDSFPGSLDIYSNLLMKWLCFMLYLFFEDVLIVLFEILPLGSWLLLMFKLYLISPRSEIFRRVFNYIEFQDELLNISFYGSLLSKHFIIGCLKMNMKLMRCLSVQHLREIDKIYDESTKTLNNIKVQARENERMLEAQQKNRRNSIEPNRSNENSAEKTFEKPFEKSFENVEKLFENQRKNSSSELKLKEKNKKANIPSTNEIPQNEDGYEFVIKQKKINKEEFEKEKSVKEEEEKKPEKKNKKVVASPIKEKPKAVLKKKAAPAKKTNKKEQPENEVKEKNNENEKTKDENKDLKERKRFIEAGVFEANVSVQTKEGSKLNPELYQDFKALVILPEKTFILQNLENETEFLRKPLKELKMISNVTLLIKVVYFLDESDKSPNGETAHYSMKLKAKNDYEEWFLPVSLFIQRDQFI